MTDSEAMRIRREIIIECYKDTHDLMLKVIEELGLNIEEWLDSRSKRC